MGTLPTATEQKTTYENFEASCRSCRCWNVFNRASDLGTFAPIAGREVTCVRCEKPFWINNDIVNPAFEMLLFEAKDFWKAKHYMQCILTSVQACEVFMAAVVSTRLLYRAYRNQQLKPFNELSTLLFRKIRRHSFAAVRNLLLRIVLDVPGGSRRGPYGHCFPAGWFREPR